MQQALKSVSDVMRAGVLSVSESTSLKSVARVMREHGVHGVLVVADDGALLGWVTARGLLRHRAEDWRRLEASDAISEPCVSVAPTSGVSVAVDALLEADATHLVVMRPGTRTPDGVVADIDLVTHPCR
jgi:CBS domain-containing protein